MHKLLQRQIRKHLSGDLSSDPTLARFLQAVDEAYEQTDEDRLLIERSLNLTSAELLERNEQLARELREIRRLELELRRADKLRAVGQLAAGIAHELNTPIQYVGDSVQFMRDAYDSLRQLQDLLEHVFEQIDRGVDARPVLAMLRQQAVDDDLPYILTHLSDAFARVREGLTRMAKSTSALKEFAAAGRAEKVLTNPNDCVMSALTLAAHELDKAATVQLVLGQLPAVLCDPGELTQVIFHLLVNAAHACAARRYPGDGRGEIRISSVAEVGCVHISVADDGCGIAPRHEPRIFEPFFTTKPLGVGNGQGLALARKIIADRHGGSLTFTSAVDGGTTFDLRLPLQRPAATSHEVRGDFRDGR